jgi:hypothetical protein
MLVVYSGVLGGVAPEGWKTGGGSGRCQGPQQGWILYGGKAKGVAGRVRYGLWGTGEGGGRRYVGLDVLN